MVAPPSEVTSRRPVCWDSLAAQHLAASGQDPHGPGARIGRRPISVPARRADLSRAAHRRRIREYKNPPMETRAINGSHARAHATQ